MVVRLSNSQVGDQSDDAMPWTLLTRLEPRAVAREAHLSRKRAHRVPLESR